MAHRNPSLNNTTTVALDHREEEVRVSFVLNALRQASALVRAAVTDGRLGHLDTPLALGDEFIAAAYERINDANRELLRLGPDDVQGVKSVFESYVEGSTFITSSLLGHWTTPSTVPATFFGRWAYVRGYQEGDLTLPWYVVTIAVAWIKCAVSLWIECSESQHLAQEVRTAFAELASVSGHEALIERLRGIPDVDLLYYVHHLLQGKEPRDDTDRLFSGTLQWASDRVKPFLPPGELELMIQAQRNLFEQLSKNPTSPTSSDAVVGLEFIGPMRMIARMSPTVTLPTDGTHQAALAQVHEEVLKGMNRFIKAAEAAQETNEMLTMHRQDVWHGKVGMRPATRHGTSVAYSEYSPSYQPSTLEGSLAKDRSNDFLDEEDEDEDGEVDYGEAEGESLYGDLDESERGDGGEEEEEDESRMKEAIQRRQHLFQMSAAVGLVPVRQEFEALDFDDSRSSYAASTLSGFSGPWPTRAPSVSGSVTSDHSVGNALQHAIAIRSRDSGPAMMPLANVTEPLAFEDDNRSNYSPSVLSQWSNHTQPRNKSTARAASSVRSFGRAPSMQSQITSASKHARSLLPPVNEEQVESVDVDRESNANVAQWAADASSITHQEETLLHEGSVATTLLEDNVALGHRVATHQAGESGLVFMLTQAHDELGQANASLNAKDHSIAQLTETLNEEKRNHAREIEQLQRNLEAAQKQLVDLRKQAAETSSFIDQMQNEGTQEIAQLGERLTLKTREVETLQRQSGELTKIVEEQASQISNLQLQIQHSSQQEQSVNEELERRRVRVEELAEQVTQRDAVVIDLQQAIAQYGDANKALEMKEKLMENERGQLQVQLQEMQLVREEEVARAKNAIEELSTQNRDLADNLEKTISEMAKLQRIVDSDKKQDQLVLETRDKELLQIQEQYNRMQTNLEEARLEAREAQKVVSETQEAIMRLGPVLGATTTSTSSDSVQTFVDRVRQQLENEKERTSQAVFGLAAATGIPVDEQTVRRESTSVILDRIRKAFYNTQAEKERAMQENLTRLVEKTGGANNVLTNNTRDLIENIQQNADRLVEENRQIREGLSALVGDTITKVSSLDLIRRAQEKVRSLEALANESRNEVTSLRQRVDLLQRELEQKREEQDRQNGDNQQKIAELQSSLQRLRQQLSWLTDQGKAREIELQQCRKQLSEKNASLENAVAANRQAAETLAIREAEFREQLRQASDESEQAERQLESLRDRLSELEQASDEKSSDVDRLRAEYENREEIARRRVKETEDRLRTLRQENDQLLQEYQSVLGESRRATETLSLQEARWNRQLQEINSELHRTEEETDDLKRRIRELEQDSEVSQREREVQMEADREQTELKEDELRSLRHEVAHLRERMNPERIQSDRHLDQEERMRLRLERDDFARRVVDLESRMQEQQDNQNECIRLNALNDQLTARLQEQDDVRALQDNLIAELRAQVAALEASTDTTRPLPGLEENEDIGLIDDDIFQSSSSTPISPDLEDTERRISELGHLLAEREYRLLELDKQVSERKEELDSLNREIDDANASLFELYETINSAPHEDLPFEEPSHPVPLEEEMQPPSPSATWPKVSLQEFKQRFAITKPASGERKARRWVLGVDAKTLSTTYNAVMHDSLLDPRMQFAYREQVDALLHQTLAFIATLGGASHEMREKRKKLFRGLDNLQRLAMAARKYKDLDGFRLGTVCELIVSVTDSIPYEGAVVRRYCELISEMAMAITLQWRDSTSQQTRRLIFTEGNLPPNDPTAVVVRFLASPFQSFDRYQLVKAVLTHLVKPKVGWMIDVPVETKVPEWTPSESILRDFDEAVPSFAPTEWVTQHLEMASTLVPGLVHVLPGQTVNLMHNDLTYVQIARLNQIGHANTESVLLVGQLGTWVVIDPLWSEEEEDLGENERQLAGVLRAPRGVTSNSDRGFALMTWIREVFVHGMAIDDVQFRGERDRERCTLEHHLKCLFHS